MKDTNVPVEKLALWIDDWYGGDGEPGEKLKEKLSQAIQAAKEEERKRIAEEVEKKKKEEIYGHLLEIRSWNSALDKAISIINKHQ